MQCQSCGTVLQPGAVACPSCGTPVPSAPSDFSSYESGGNTVPYIPYAPAVETASVSSSQPSPGPQLYMGAPPFPDRGIQPFPGAVQQPSPSQQQRVGLSAGMVALLVILALLFVAAGSGLTYYLIALRPAQHQAQATAVVPIILTTQTPAKAQQTTPLTATNPQDLYTQATSGTPALTDPLSPQNPNQWSSPDGRLGSCTFTGNALHARATPSGSKLAYSSCVARSTSFGNFAYQVSATILHGDASGLFFRYDALGSTAYAFLISSEGVYELAPVQGNNFKVLAGGSSSAINTGLKQSNLLTVIARGSTIYLYVNQQYLTSISDNTSSSGEIGVFGENTGGGHVDVAFSKIQVWKL
jgi:hypothetical protein